ncbi:MAG: hypothetical protein ACR2P5_08300 [Gammaproteobacteria bacterium]
MNTEKGLYGFIRFCAISFAWVLAWVIAAAFVFASSISDSPY